MSDELDHLSENYRGVMVSSTFTDLKQHRVALIKAIDGQELKSVVMENDSAKANVDVLDSSLQMVRKASAYIGLISHRYGQIPEDNERNPNRLSLTELEFNEAQRLKRPVLIFIMGDNHPVTKNDVETDPEKIEKLNKFRESAKFFHPDFKIHRVYKLFDTLDEFKDSAIHAIANLRQCIKDINGACTDTFPTPPSQFANQALLQKYISKELTAFNVIKLPSIIPPGVPLIIPINQLYVDLPLRLTRPWRHDEVDSVDRGLGNAE